MEKTFTTGKRQSRLVLLPAVFLVLFLIGALFFFMRGKAPYASELGYIEHSSLGQNAGSVVPASCSSVPQISHFNGDCMRACPGGVGTYDPWFNPSGSGCPAVGPAPLCGPAYDVSTTYAPTVGLCSSGTSSAVDYMCEFYDGENDFVDLCSNNYGYSVFNRWWSWYCHTTSYAWCTAPYVDPVFNGICGSFANQALLSAPTYGLCDSGTPSSVTQLATCASFTGCSQVIAGVVGVHCPITTTCGYYDEDLGEYVYYACTGYGDCSLDPHVAQWKWSCNGTGGGTTSNCSARLAQTNGCAYGTDSVTGAPLTVLRPSTAADPLGGKVVPGGKYKAPVGLGLGHICFRNDSGNIYFAPVGTATEFSNFWAAQGRLGLTPLP